MLDPTNVPNVTSDELLARFIFQRSHIRAKDNTVKPNAFMPPENRQVSVTRHLQTTPQELWDVGVQIGQQRSTQLVGRADIQVTICQQHRLSVCKAPEPDNPNHANIIDWPAEKDEQKMIAQELAAAARYLAPTGKEVPG